MQTITLDKQTVQKLQNPAAKSAAARLETLGLPSKKTEAYRYFDIISLFQREYEIYSLEKKEIQESEVIKIVDGIVISAPESVQVSYKKERVIAPEHFDALYYLGHLLSQEVIELSFTEDANVKIVHEYTQENALIAYRVVIQTKANISLKINESFRKKLNLLIQKCHFLTRKFGT